MPALGFRDAPTAGPGPATLHASHHAHTHTYSQRYHMSQIQKKTSLPSLSTAARFSSSSSTSNPAPIGHIPSASSSTTSLRDSHTSKPVSILRKPSLPTLPSSSLLSPALQSAAAPTGHSTHVPWTPTPIGSSSDSNNSNMALTASSIAFPPLPPLPSFPLDSHSHSSSSSYDSNSNRRSAPPTTTTFAAASGSVRLRTRRSRVSFREHVDVSGEADSSRPRSTASVPGSASSIRRGSSGDDALMRKATTPTSAYSKLSSASVSAPRPKLKRVASSTAVLPPPTKALSTDDFDAFRPQTLRYPKMPSALARLSDTSVPPPAPNTWSSSRKVSAPARTSVPLPLPATKEHPSSSHFVSEFGQVDVPSRRERTVSQISQTSSRKGKTRSPIPSWSSTCPSLINAHRASIASTLTAPSMTSLLLSPQSPHEVYLPSKDEQQAFEDHLATPWAPESVMHDFDVPEMDALKEKRAREADLPATEACVTEPVKPRVPSRRHRGSEPLQPPSSFNAPPPPPSSSSCAPRAAERLLRLQNSLADLRMQRSMTRSPEPEVQEPAPAPAPPAGPPRATPRTVKQRPSLGMIHTPSACKVPSPPSPTFGDLVRSAPRSAPGSLKGRGARRPPPASSYSTLDQSDGESDLDLTLPPLNAALRSHVIPSSSRLLVTKTRTRGLSQGGADEAPTGSGLGWSGSESEEEEFSRTVARIASRKNLTSNTRKLQKRPSLPVGRMNAQFTRHSLGTGDGASQAPASPSVAHRPASAIGTMRSTGTAALLSALVEQKYASTQALPRPKKYVTGWGAPEVLHDDDWPPLEEVAEVGEAW